MQKSQDNSRRLVWIAIGVVAVVLVIISVFLYVFLGSPAPEEKPTTANAPAESTVASPDEVKQDIATLNTQIDQANSDLEAAKAALEEDKAQIKVGN